MGAPGNGNQDDVLGTINITPFVDVMLVLLIIFMVTAKFIVAPAIKVELPRAVSEDTLDKEKPTLSIFMGEDGKIAFSGLIHDLTDGERDSLFVAPGELNDLLARIHEKFPEAQVAIQAYRRVPHGRVIGMIDLLKTNGIETFAFNVDPNAREMLLNPEAAQTDGPGPAQPSEPVPVQPVQP